MSLFKRKPPKLKAQPLGLLRITDMRLPDIMAMQSDGHVSQAFAEHAFYVIQGRVDDPEMVRRVNEWAQSFTTLILQHVKLAPGVDYSAAGELIYLSAQVGVAIFRLEAQGGVLPDGPYVDPRVQNALIIAANALPDVNPSADMLSRWAVDSAYIYARASSTVEPALPWAFSPEFVLKL